MTVEIKKILGYRREGEDEYFQVCWTDHTRTWEAAGNLSSREHVQAFFRRCLQKIDTIVEHLDTVDRKTKENSLISAIRSLNKGTAGTALPDAGQKNSAGNVARGPTKQEHKSIPPRTSMLILNEPDAKQQKLVSLGRRIPIIETAPLFRQRDSPFPAGTKRQPPPRSISQAPTCDVFLKLGGNEIASFASKAYFGTGASRFSFDAEKCVFISVDSLLLQILMPRTGGSLSIFVLSLVGNTNKFMSCSERLSRERLMLLSTEDSTHFHFLLSSNEDDALKRHDLLFRYYLVKIARDGAPQMQFALEKRPLLQTDLWRQDSIKYQSLLEDQLIYAAEEEAGGCYFGLVHEEGPERRTLVEALIGRGKTLVQLSDSRIEFVAVSQNMLQFVHHLPEFQRLLSTRCSFFLVSHRGASSSFCLVEIFKKNVLVTITRKFIDGLDLRKFLDFLRREDRLLIRIPQELLWEFKKRFDGQEHSPDHEAVKAVYKRLRESVEDFECGSIKEYLECLQKKYHRSHRLIRMLNDVTVDSDVLGLDDLVEEIGSVL
jgi:hypothetical protein